MTAKRIFLGLAALALFGLALFIWRFHLQHRPVAGDVANFKDTEIVAHPDVPLSPDKNVIWCGTMALAWNEAIRNLGKELHFADQPREADLLNRQEFTKADLDEQSYVVFADRQINHLADRIRAALKMKFGDSFEARLLPDDSVQDPKKIIVFACLNKDLEFPKPFNNNVPLRFGLRRVANFGFGLELADIHAVSNGEESVRSQAKVLSYVSDDHFVIQLKTKEKLDQLILAKIPPGKTLQATIDSVLPALGANKPWGVGDEDVLAVPKIDFDLTADFQQFEGKRLTTDDVRIDRVAEDILFKLNETGVKLTTFTVICASLGIASPGSPPRHFIFDKPFLVLLKRESSSRPYFVLWVGNPTLLVSP